MKFDVESIERHPILDVAVESIRFLYQQMPDARMAPKIFEHCLKLVRPVFFSVSTSTYCWATTNPILSAYSRNDATWASIEKRSAEQKSELQSLMRNSYAVLCMKKKTRTQHNPDELH